MRCIGRGKRVKKNNSVRNTKGVQLWLLRCICGEVIELKRGSFDGGKQISCGCIRGTPLMKATKKPHDITGKRFGELTAIALTGNKINSKPTWLFKCNCGEKAEFSLSAILQKKRNNKRINCGNHEWGCWYPSMPIPIPLEVSNLMQKYLNLCETVKYKQIKQHVQDEKRDRLMRVCWIVVYKRNNGEQISLKHEENFVKKYLRFAPIAAHHKECGKIRPTNRKGSVMTKQQLPTYPSIKKTMGIKTLPKNISFIRR